MTTSSDQALPNASRHRRGNRTGINGKSGFRPKRLTNEERRGKDRESLTLEEVEQLRTAALRGNRRGLRDATAILLAVRHGLRVSELVELKWEQVVNLDLTGHAELRVERLKGSVSNIQPLEPEEVTALKALRKQAEPGAVYIFEGPGGDHLKASGFRKMLSRVADEAGLGHLHVHPHMLRHTCGHEMVKVLNPLELAKRLGHASLQNTYEFYVNKSCEDQRGAWGKVRRR
jgi:type 1 fimbriae regulatory protein FimB/type 1 fimbriae regulatory protein FimE